MVGAVAVVFCAATVSPQAPHLPGRIPLGAFHSAVTMLPFQKTPPFQNLYLGQFSKCKLPFFKQTKAPKHFVLIFANNHSEGEGRRGGQGEGEEGKGEGRRSQGLKVISKFDLNV